MEESLSKLYKDYGFPGTQRLWSIAKSKLPGITLKDVKEFREKQETSQLHQRAPSEKQNKRHITSAGNGLDYQADLLSLGQYARSNQGMHWCLLVEDIFNRKAFGAPLKTKSPNDVLPALNKAFEVLGKPLLTLTTDQGGEFKGVVDKKLKDLHIVHHTAELGQHNTLGMINSLCRFVKNALHKHFTYHQTTNWVDYLPTLVDSYNNTPHTGLQGMTPLEGEQFETDTRNLTYNKVVKHDKPLKFHVGDHVRILKRKMTFDRGYETRWSLQIHTITAIDGQRYVLSNGKSYLENQLQRVRPPIKKNDVEESKENQEEKEESKQEVYRAPLEPGRKRDPTPEPPKPERSQEGRADVARIAKKEKKIENTLKFQEGISQSNRREGLRSRSLASQLLHPRYGRINW